MKSSTQSKHSSKSIVNYESHSILHDKTKILSTHSSKYGSLKTIPLAEQPIKTVNKQDYIKVKIDQVIQQMFEDVNKQLSTDFLYYMKRKMEISEHNDKVRKRIFHAYKSGFGPKLESKLLRRKIQDHHQFDKNEFSQIMDREDYKNKMEYYKKIREKI